MCIRDRPPGGQLIGRDVLLQQPPGRLKKFFSGALLCHMLTSYKTCFKYVLYYTRPAALSREKCGLPRLTPVKCLQYQPISSIIARNVLRRWEGSRRTPNDKEVQTMKYDFASIEPKWQKKWRGEKTFAAANGGDKPKFYGLVEFPYPSGQGLHVGHARPYTCLLYTSRCV